MFAGFLKEQEELIVLKNKFSLLEDMFTSLVNMFIIASNTAVI